MFRRRGKKTDESPDDVYEALRAQALTLAAEMLGDPPSDHPDVVGVVVDIPSSGGAATVIAMADGTTSMYTSTGGGTIGAGTRPDVASQSHALLSTLQGRIDLFPSDDRTDLPQDDFVQITIISTSGRRRATVPAAAFWGNEPSTVHDIIGAIHRVITALREATPPT